jgi:hypothetical protein
MDYAADYAAVVDTRMAMGTRKVGFDAFELGFTEPMMI